MNSSRRRLGEEDRMIALDKSGFYADTYPDAREIFLRSSAAAGANLTRFEHPISGPGGELLATDVAQLGDLHAKRMLVLVSGTHGVEGFCGSALQSLQLEMGV